MSADSLASQRTLLLADDAEPDTVAKFAAERAWSTVDDADVSVWPGASLQAAWRTDRDVLVAYTEHQLYGTRLVTVAGETGYAETVLADIQALVPTVSVEAVLGVLSAEPLAEPVDLIRAARQLATIRLIVTAEGGDDPGHEVIDRHACHPSPHVRRAVRLVVPDGD